MFNVEESAREYSSVYNKNPAYNLEYSKIDSASAWAPLNKKGNNWMRLDLGKIFLVTGVVTQGRNLEQGDGIAQQWVTSYTVETSIDGTSFEKVDNGGAEFDGH